MFINVINPHIIGVKRNSMRAKSTMDEIRRSGAPAPGDRAPHLRRVPSQRRSRERVERMLAVATALIVERGLDAVRMSEIAERSEVSIGSLYQYFPDKAAMVRTLAERYNAEGRACVEAELAAVGSDAALLAALHRVVDGYYQMFLREPVMRDIWRATQADKALQELDAADCEAHAATLCAVLARLRPADDGAVLKTSASLLMQLIATAVRHAISLERPQGDAAIAQFKAMLTACLPEVLEAPGQKT